MANSNSEEIDTDSTGKHQESHEGQPGNDDLRQLSYMLLFVGAVFIINAMETGSYRTPWPVAIITTIAGICLFAYSRNSQQP